jgi:hypothetical protein
MELNLPYKIGYIYEQRFLKSCECANYDLKDERLILRGANEA